MRLRGIFVAVALASASAVSVTIPAQALSTALDQPCAAVEVIVARGSGQPIGDSHELGTFTTVLDAHINGATTVHSYELGSEAQEGHQYPAVNVSEWWNGNIFGAFFSGGQAFDYGNSVNEGVLELINYGMQRGFDCPSSRFVLAGYSQGAQVIGQSLEYLSTLEGQTDFVAFLGDPKLYLPEGEGIRPPACRGKDYSPWRRVVPDCRTDDGSLGARKPYVPVGFIDKTGLWCNNDDFVCGSSKFGKTSGHMVYGDAGNGAEKAAEEAATRLAVSLGGTVADHMVWDIGHSGGTAGLDVVFLLDTTGSMSGRIYQARQFASQMADSISAARGRVALVTYKDSGDAYTARIDSPLTSDLAQFKNALNAQYASGGGDYPEALLHGLMTAFDGLDWKDGATKAAIVLTDASWHDPDWVDGSTLESMAARSLEIDPVNVYAVVPSYLVQTYQPVADATAGKVIADDGDTLAALTEALNQITSRPVALIRNAEYSAEVGEEVTFDVSESYGVGAPIVRYDWDFDGDSVYDAQSTAPTFDHTYDAVFDGQVQVRVTASDGGVGSISAPVRIGMPLPAVPTAPAVTVAATSVTGGVGNVTLSWTGNPEAVSWLVAVNDVPLGLTRDNPVTISDIQRAQEVTFSVTPVTADGTLGQTGTATLPAASTGKVVYSAESLTLTNGFQTAGQDAGVATGGDFECNSSVAVAGDVTVAGNAYLTNACSIAGDLWAGGTVTMDSAAAVGGSIRAVGSVTVQSTSHVGGDIVTAGGFRSVEGLTDDALHTNGTVTGQIVRAAAVSAPQVADLHSASGEDPLTGATPITAWSVWINGIAATNGAPAWSTALTATPGCTMAAGSYSVNGADVTVAEDTVIDARAVTGTCAAVALQGMSLHLTGDLTIVADSFSTVGKFAVVSADGRPHRLRVLVPASVGTAGPGVSFAQGAVIDPVVRVAVEAPGKVSVQGLTAFTGAVSAGQFVSTGTVTISAP